jgi:hypothetical protein
MDHVAIAGTAVYSGSFDPPLLYPSSTARYLRLDWSPATSIAGIAGYQIRRQVNGGTATVLNGTLTPNPWFVDFTPPDGYLDYGVRAVDGLTQPGTDGWVVQAYESNPPAVPAAPQNLGWSLEEITAEAAPFWLLDEGLGSTTADASGLEHTGQLGGPGNGDSAEPSWIQGITGSALHFDGSNDVVEVADAATLRFTGSFTVESWVRRTQLGSAQAVIAKDEGSSKRNYLVLILSNGFVEFSWRDASGSSTRKATSSTGITDMNWHHVACVFEQPLHQSRIYLDGVQVAASTTNGTPYTGVQPLRFGARGASSGGGSLSDLLRGDLDLVRITPAARYTGAFTPETFLFGGRKRNAVRVTWGLPPSGLVQDYRVYRQLLPSGTNTLVATLPYVPSPSFLDTGPLPDQSVRYTIRARNSDNVEGPASSPLDLTMPQPTDAAAGPPAAPTRLALDPNPFNPSATVRFHLDRPGPVDLALFDAKGRRVTSVVRGELAAGSHRIPVFTDRAPRLSSGVYFLRLVADGRETRLKAVLVR